MGKDLPESELGPNRQAGAELQAVRLMREIRFSIDRDWARAAHGADGFEGALPVTNSWGGWPSAVGVAPYLVLQIVVSGMPDPVTGYLVNIQELDHLLRRHAIPMAAQRLEAEGVGLTGENLVQGIWAAVSGRLSVLRERQADSRARGLEVSSESLAPKALSGEPQAYEKPPAGRRCHKTDHRRDAGATSAPSGNSVDPRAGESSQPHLVSLALWTTPYLSYTICAGGASMVELTQWFEFSASHRLHVASMSEEENLRVFGKCNNPNGHGHNYRVEVTVAGEVSDRTGRVIPLPAFESIVKQEVIDRFDHKHLNADMAEFAELNPSVENIARTIWGLLEGKISPGGLRRVRVWETAKTYAEYSAP